jgi:hypothetical protein
MIEQCLSNKNKSATVSKSKKKLQTKPSLREQPQVRDTSVIPKNWTRTACMCTHTASHLCSVLFKIQLDYEPLHLCDNLQLDQACSFVWKAMAEREKHYWIARKTQTNKLHVY